MGLFTQDGSALVRRGGQESVRVEPWGQDSLRVRGTVWPTIRGDRPGARLDWPAPSAAGQRAGRVRRTGLRPGGHREHLPPAGDRPNPGWRRADTAADALAICLGTHALRSGVSAWRRFRSARGTRREAAVRQWPTVVARRTDPCAQHGTGRRNGRNVIGTIAGPERRRPRSAFAHVSHTTRISSAAHARLGGAARMPIGHRDRAS